MIENLYRFVLKRKKVNKLIFDYAGISPLPPYIACLVHVCTCTSNVDI